MADDDEVLKQAFGWLEAGKTVALATVVGTWGSSPRPPGSMMAVSGEGAFVGSVSGGCIEGAVITEAQEIIAGGAPRLLDFGVSDEQAWEVGLACGGEMKVFLEEAPSRETLSRLLDERPIALATHLESGARAVVRPDRVGGELALGAESLAAARLALVENRSAILEDPAGPVFVCVFNPPLRMVIVGAVHIAQCLAPMAAIAGFDVTVVDPRRAFATDARFPGVKMSTAWPDDALDALGPDQRTAVVTLTHDPKLDDPALAAALGSDAYYVGALGSRRTHARRLDRLRQAGVSAEALERIHSPIGLPLGGREATEIAVAILAEAVTACHGKRLKS